MQVPSRVLPWLGGLVLLPAAGLLYSYNPVTSGLFPPCPFYWLTHLHCPGCGSTRALHNLLHGDVVTAFDMNPLLVLSIPFVALLTLRPSISKARYLPAVVGVVLVGYGILRNFKAFDFLAP